MQSKFLLRECLVVVYLTVKELRGICIKEHGSSKLNFSHVEREILKSPEPSTYKDTFRNLSGIHLGSIYF